MGKQYMTFVRNNMDQVAKKITDDLWVLSAMEVRRTNQCFRARLEFAIISALVH